MRAGTRTRTCIIHKLYYIILRFIFIFHAQVLGSLRSAALSKNAPFFMQKVYA